MDSSFKDRRSERAKVLMGRARTMKGKESEVELKDSFDMLAFIAP